MLKRLADAKVVINASDAHQPNRGRQWAGLGLVTAAVVGIFALSATERRASSESLTELAGVEFPGTIGPSKRFALKSDLNGTVKRVLVEVGDQVAVNQALIEIDDAGARDALGAALLDEEHATAEVTRWQKHIAALDTTFERATTALAESSSAVAVAQRYLEQVPGRQFRDSPQRAQAAFDQASSKLERARRLHEQGIISDETLDDHVIAVRIARDDLENARRWEDAALQLQRAQQQQAERQVVRSRAEFERQRADYVTRLADAETRADQATQRVTAAKRLLDNAVVKSAVTGVVVDIAVAVGDRPGVGTPLLSIARLDELAVEVPVSPLLINVLRPGLAATVILPTLPQERVEGRIEAINPIPSADMTHRVEVRFPNAAGRLLSGQPAHVIFGR